ncbi:MAG: redoxin domain-containing protein [Alphaproteobacteria bacterium]|nr:redoxin domain-containing protein [Alphaproteobacteria bacterium]
MCSSEVSDTEHTLRQRFEGTEGLTTLWSFFGPEHRAEAWIDQYGLTFPVLVDEDGSLYDAWFVGQADGDAWAGNPRHYVIDREGILVYASTSPSPEALVDALEATLADSR